jgi:NTE family protein
MKNVAVISGGGALGAFVVGAMQSFQHFGYWKYDAFFGVSTGALIGAGCAQGDFDRVLREYMDMTPERITKGRLTVANTVRALLFGNRGVMDNSPLRKRIDEILDVSRLKHRFFCGSVNLETGGYMGHFFGPGMASGQNEAYRSAVHASATMPFAWWPVKVGDNAQVVDGGVRNVIPLADAIRAGAESITVFLCAPRNLAFKPMPRPKLSDVAMRSLEILMNENSYNDIDNCLLVNEICRAAGGKVEMNGRTYKYIPIRIVEPSEDLGDALNFDNETARKNVLLGYEHGTRLVNKGFFD